MQLLDGYFKDRFQGAERFVPACDIEETDTHYRIEAELPGFDRADIKVDLRGTELSISGVKKRERRAAGGVYETQTGSFKRLFVLPENVEQDAVSAQYRDGVLRLDIAKPSAALPKRIDVK